MKHEIDTYNLNPEQRIIFLLKMYTDYLCERGFCDDDVYLEKDENDKDAIEAFMDEYIYDIEGIKK